MSVQRGPATRGRVVMIVDTDVRSDSRVQKMSRSAAQAGWDVVLLGRARGATIEEFTIGDAQVRLLPTPPVPAGRASATGTSARGTGWRTRATGAVSRWRPRATAAVKRWLRRRAATRLIDRGRTWFWRAVLGDRCWRRLEPHLWDFERSFGPVIDELQPDLIHSNDFRMIGVGARAALRGRAAGRPVKLLWDAHEYLPGLKPWRDNAHWLPAHCAYEREYVPYADAAITVSEALAELLQREHGLARRPRVVLNAPDLDDVDEGATLTDLRDDCGVGPDAPLLVFCGNITAVRGVDVIIDALPELPNAHLALVSLAPGREPEPYVTGLLARAAELGVADRIHLLPYVPYQLVPRYIAAADCAVSPLVRLGNHEIALSNKFLDYSHARLPLVVSDVGLMADIVRRTGQGEVFQAGDVADFARATRKVLAQPARYRAAYDAPGLLAGWTWQAQATVLEDVYRSLLPDGRPEPANIGVTS